VTRHLDPGPGDRILEVGCGRGHLVDRLRQLGAETTGVDANPHAAEVAVVDGIHVMRAESLAFEDGSFDKLVAIHSIEHIPDLETAIAEMARVLRPRGRALFVYPAEPIQGIWAIPTAIVLHGNPLRARQVHCQWLWPARVRAVAGPWFDHVHSEFNLVSSPQFVTVVERRRSG
jgi:SAM-dependent methyltransferase